MRDKGVVLVVDDSPDCLLALTEVMAAEGYNVRQANSGETALAAVAVTSPELILLDVRMPGMNGFEVCQRLKKSKRTRAIPIIFLSGITDVEEHIEGLRIGAVDFVSKPFRKEELLARVRNHLELGRLRMQLEHRLSETTTELRAANQRFQLELTERLRAEQAQRESEMLFRSMADTAAVMIWTSGADTKVNFYNRFALAFTGRSMGELTADGWKSVVHPEDLALKYPTYVPTIEAHREYQVSYRVRRADGEYRWMLDTATPRFLANGEFAGYVGIVIDITDLKKSQERLSAAQKLESLGVLVSGVTHTVNNVLGTILAESDLALADIPSESAARECLERIGSVACRASEMMALLMEYSGTGGSGAPTPVNVYSAVEETLRLFRATVSKKVDLSVNLASGSASVRADRSQIPQVVMALLTNAWEALGNQSGSIRISTSCVVIRSSNGGEDTGKLPPGNYICLEVTDTGCGIPTEALGRIFDPFYTTKSLGRGLGLAAVQGIVRALAGSIDARSTPAYGSSFRVLLPRCDE